MEALLHGAVDALLPLLHTLQNILEHQQLTFPVDLRMLLFQARAGAQGPGQMGARERRLACTAGTRVWGVLQDTMYHDSVL